MLKLLSLSNFKSFKSMEKLRLSNLTIIVGRNSCGKSSIMQSLLLLKQTLESENEGDLCMDGRYLRFSSLKEASHGLPAVNRANIGYKFAIEDHHDKELCGEITLEFRNKKQGDTYVPALTKFLVSTDNGLTDLRNLNKSQILKSYGFMMRDKRLDKVFRGCKQYFDKFMPQAIELTYAANKKPKDMESTTTLKAPIAIGFPKESRLAALLDQSLRNLRYLSPVRAIPQRAYVHYSQDVGQLKDDGSNAAHIFFSKRREPVSWKGIPIPLEDAVNECIDLVGLSQALSPKRIGQILYQVSVSINELGPTVSLADVGFGYSQLLPIILLGLLNGPECLMLIEQPEIHLHPSSAGRLADLFLGFAKDDKHFVIETHSQEFVNRLRLRVIQNPDLREKINVVFIEQNKTASTIKQFEIDEKGMFPEWPKGFIDESEKLASEILNARLDQYK